MGAIHSEAKDYRSTGFTLVGPSVWNFNQKQGSLHQTITAESVLFQKDSGFKVSYGFDLRHYLWKGLFAYAHTGIAGYRFQNNQTLGIDIGSGLGYEFKLDRQSMATISVGWQQNLASDFQEAIKSN